MAKAQWKRLVFLLLAMLANLPGVKHGSVVWPLICIVLFALCMLQCIFLGGVYGHYRHLHTHKHANNLEDTHWWSHVDLDALGLRVKGPNLYLLRYRGCLELKTIGRGYIGAIGAARCFCHWLVGWSILQQVHLWESWVGKLSNKRPVLSWLLD